MAVTPPLIIQWNREHFYLNYTDEDLRVTTLGQLKEVCREITGVPTNLMKVVFNGGIMKDDKATLDRYGIYVGAKLKLVGVQENGKKDKEMTPTEQQEHKSIQRIDHIVQKTSDQLLERMQNYVANAQLFKKQFLDSSSETYQAMMQASPDDFMGIRNSEKQNLHKDYVFITETLMQSLLSIDNVPLDDGADLGRNRRKQAVKQLQGWMDQMDKVRQSVEYNDESGNKSEGSDEGEMQNKL